MHILTLKTYNKINLFLEIDSLQTNLPSDLPCSRKKRIIRAHFYLLLIFLEIYFTVFSSNKEIPLGSFLLVYVHAT